MDNTKKESRSDMVVSEQDILETVDRKSTTDSESYSTTENKKVEGFVSRFLSEGENRAVTADELADLMGIEGSQDYRSRMVRHYVAHEREGHIICSSPKGYFLPERDESGELTPKGVAEVRRFYHKTHSMGVSMLKSAKTAKEFLESHDAVLPGQMEIVNV